MNKTANITEEVLRIMFIEDVRTDVELIWHELEKRHIVFERLLVTNKSEFLQGLEEFAPDVIISDYSLPQFDGMKALIIRNEKAPFVPFILVTGHLNEEVAVECMKSGADDYILKENLSRLVPALKNSVNKAKLQKAKQKSEEDLFKANMRLQSAQAMAHVGNWEIDLAIKKVWCSEEALKIYGFDTDCNQLDLDQIFSVPIPECRKILDEAFDKLLLYNEPYEVEFRISRKSDGEIRSIHSKAERIISDDEKVKIAGVIQDITDRKKAEEELLQSNILNESLLRTIPFGMDIVDEDGSIMFQSDNLKLLTGSDSIGKKCWDVYCDNKARCSGCPLLAGIKLGETEVIESRGILGNRVFEVSHTGMMYKGKKAILEIFQDITDRKENEEELLQTKEKAVESDKLKTAFLHNISHEIRTPMNAIVGFSALLTDPATDSQTRQSYIDVIIQSSNHLLSIISDIVDISNIEARLVKIVKADVNLNAKLKILTEQYLPKATEKKIDFIVETTLEYADSFILTDITKLLQVITNLINNSLKFTHSGHIRLKYMLKNNFLEFSISDTGIGIPVEHHKKIFERFFQVQNTVSRVYEGTGLGLSISKAYVELLGGEMWLESEPGKGTTFYFTIPFEKSYTEKDAAADRSEVEIINLPAKKTILIAEDIDSNFKLLKYFLSGTGFEIIRAVNGKEAVDICMRDSKIDLILMDIKMPVMDGYTAVKLIRERFKDIPIIAQTAYADDRDKALTGGCSGFISKPFDKKGLMRVLSDYI
jgi:PAS domain S-box-containing protein